MPVLDDYDPNDEKTQGGFGADGSSGSSSGGGQLFGGASKQHEQAYTPWSRFTSANSEVAGREAGKLQQQVGGDITSAMSGLDNANAAYNKGIAANYQQQGNQAGTEARAQGGKQAAQGVGNAFGGSSWASFGAPTAQTQQAPSLAMAQPGVSPAKAAADRRGAPSPPPPQQVGRGSSPFAPPPAAPLGRPNAVAPGSSGTGLGGGAELTKDPQVNANALANGPRGPKDLESSMAPSAWDSLTGKVTKANDEATQLGSQSGVQALLSQNSGAPATGFDAALINQNGQQGFADASAKFGNGVLTGQQANSEQASQNAWSKLGGDIDQQKKTDAARAGAQQVDADNARGVTDLAGPAGPKALSETEQQAANIAQSARQDFGKQLGVFGDRSGMIGALENDTPNSKNYNANSSAQVKFMLDQLGISNAELRADIAKMTEDEYTMFAMGGIIPKWMQTGKNLPTGQLRGWSGFVSDKVTADSSGGTGETQGKMNEKQYSDLAKIWLQMLAG